MLWLVSINHVLYDISSGILNYHPVLSLINVTNAELKNLFYYKLTHTLWQVISLAIPMCYTVSLRETYGISSITICFKKVKEIIPRECNLCCCNLIWGGALSQRLHPPPHIRDTEIFLTLKTSLEQAKG